MQTRDGQILPDTPPLFRSAPPSTSSLLPWFAYEEFASSRETSPEVQGNTDCSAVRAAVPQAMASRGEKAFLGGEMVGRWSDLGRGCRCCEGQQESAGNMVGSRQWFAVAGMGRDGGERHVECQDGLPDRASLCRPFAVRGVGRRRLTLHARA